ncbi:carboxymuconolactone decarboxylase family protein [Pseudomonas sp. PWP3-1b2]|uniref:carboxymuconolactone decarboxylase family protein n=1 Tax=Pseudomonas sp. PWP3-1b2 TaxID=2804656 RepID=UPI003CF3ACC5
MKLRSFLLAGCIGAVSVSAMAADRMPPLAPETLTAAQKNAIDLVAKSVPPGGSPRSIGTSVLLRDPELLNRLQDTGAYLRYHAGLEPRLAEFVILMTLRHWSNQNEWHAHEKLAPKAGLSSTLIRALAEGQRPVGMPSDEEALYDFFDELHRNKSVSDATYQRVHQKWGDRGVIDFVALDGYYATLAAVFNVAQTPLPAGVPAPLPSLPR